MFEIIIKEMTAVTCSVINAETADERKALKERFEILLRSAAEMLEHELLNEWEYELLKEAHVMDLKLFD